VGRASGQEIAAHSQFALLQVINDVAANPWGRESFVQGMKQKIIRALLHSCRQMDRMPSVKECRTDRRKPGAIGFDWVFVNQGGVPRLISWPRKKLITNNCKTAVLTRSLEISYADLRIPA